MVANLPTGLFFFFMEGSVKQYEELVVIQNALAYSLHLSKKTRPLLILTGQLNVTWQFPVLTHSLG